MNNVMIDITCEFLFADDCELNAVSVCEIQHNVDKFAAACSKLRLTICAKKTEVMYQPAPGKAYKEPTITIDDTEINVVTKFNT